MPGFELNSLEDDEGHYRVILALVAVLAGCVFIGALSFLLPPPPADIEAGAGEIYFSAVLLGRGGRAGMLYPLTVQNVMWLMFYFTLGELWVRFHRARREMQQLVANPLPAQDDSILLRQGKDLVPIYQWTTRDRRARGYLLQRAILRVVQQFQISGSIDQANNLLNTSLELMQHELELKYNMVRYLTWLIPTLGFIGTVIGIALALAAAGDMPTDLTAGGEIRGWFAKMTFELGIAFYTTLVALLMAALLVFVMHISQGREEAALNTVGQYCVDNLVNRLVPSEG